MGIEIRELSFLGRPSISISVPSGTCAGLSGPSGSGKSMFLKCIADLLPHTGEVILNGCPQSGVPAPEWRRKMALLPAQSAWWFDTVGEHFTEMNPEMLAKLGFSEDIATWSIRRLSSGEKQRLAILRMLARKPEAILLDEPTANLDESNAGNAETILSTYIQTNRVPAIWVSHSPDQLRRISGTRFHITAEGISEQSGDPS